MLEDRQHFTGPAHDVLDNLMACKHLEPGFAMTVRVAYHGTTDRGLGLCGHHTGPLPEFPISLSLPVRHIE